MGAGLEVGSFARSQRSSHQKIVARGRYNHGGSPIMLSEFKEFIAKGNVMDLAVGVIIGAAFQRIVDSMVTDIIMPVVGLATGGTDFTNQFVVLRDGVKAAAPYASLADAKAAGATVIAFGSFLNQVIQFLILAWVVFLMVKAVNRMRRKSAPITPPPSA